MAKRSTANRRTDKDTGDGFWDRPVMMNLLADLLFLIGGALLAWSGAVALQNLPAFPLQQLVVATPLDQVSRAQIEHTARTVLTGNFFTVNLDASRAAFERMPWVRTASLRRLWPDGVELSIEEHRAVARWTPQEGESRLVSVHGEVFAASSDAALPRLIGPEGSAPRVLERFRAFSEALASTGRKPIVVHLSAREAWQVKLDDGVVLELGRDQPKHPLADRLDRYASNYVAASAAVKGRLPAIGTVDLRYPNGFALRPRASGQS
ncbi:MAG: FtsQ-type POTRA domain-containing protein [Rhodocyclales bacterium]|nr:FtsQ-type POTRA domain-containing protein [Rhodocyclales bacterium]